MASSSGTKNTTGIESLFTAKGFSYDAETVKKNNERWESGLVDGTSTKVGRYYAKRALVIKSIAITVIGGANLLILGGVLTVMVMYCPIPSEALFASPFVVGVFLAASRLKLPTWDVNRYTYTYLSNPLSLVGEMITYILFGPYQYAVKHIDATDYSHAETATFISKEILSATFIHTREECREKFVKVHEFEVFAETYLRRHDKLRKYGYITAETSAKLEVIYLQYKYFRSDLKNEVVPYLSGDADKVSLEITDKNASFTESDDDDDDSIAEEHSPSSYEKQSYKAHCNQIYQEQFGPRANIFFTAEQRYGAIIADIAKQYEEMQAEIASELPFPPSRRARPNTVKGTSERVVNRLLRRAVPQTPSPAQKVG